ncbi:MAG: hypothetical protein H0W70_06095 [Actinobacteria bacterium]|nr:hypothetical protein [Actinomycetota bacterium]
MIFTSLGILVTAGAFLIAGIVRSSIPLLVVSLIGTAVAAFTLLATADMARRRAWENSGLPVAGSNGGAGGAPPGTQPVVMYVPIAQSVGASVGAAGANGGGGTTTATGSPLLGYDDMTAGQITKLVISGALTTEQLIAVRRHEKATAARKTVLDRLDRAIRS